ncbi:hypothetical protein FRC01_005388 [Tulasnella sp. 417]|nr:hypothetical protein FRC01_005388 [Tulasnella sp. 417]
MATSGQEEKQRKPRAKEIPWAKNQVWTRAVITRLLEDPTLCRNTFSESTAEAKANGHSKAKFGKSSKSVYFEELAQSLFGQEDPFLKIDAECVEDFKKDPKRYGQSVRSHFASLKKSYIDKTLYLSFGMFLLDTDVPTCGTLDEIRNEWPFWDSLHSMWREMPNYIPLCVVSSDADLDPGAAFDRALMGTTNLDGEEDDVAQNRSDDEISKKDDGNEEGRIEGWYQTPQNTLCHSAWIATTESAKASPFQVVDSSSPTAPKSNTKQTPNKKGKAGVPAKGGCTASKGNHLDTFGERQKEESKRLATLDNLLFKGKITALEFQTTKLCAQEKEWQRQHDAAQANHKAQERWLVSRS